MVEHGLFAQEIDEFALDGVNQVETRAIADAPLAALHGDGGLLMQAGVGVVLEGPHRIDRTHGTIAEETALNGILVAWHRVYAP